MKKYINVKTCYGLETVDEFCYNTRDERREAKRCLREYNFGDQYNYYYLSQRCTKDWNNK